MAELGKFEGFFKADRKTSVVRFNAEDGTIGADSLYLHNEIFPKGPPPNGFRVKISVKVETVPEE
jgi:hypothetical protein